MKKFVQIAKNCGFGDESKNNITGEVMAIRRKNLFLLLILKKIPRINNNPENWIKFPNCSDPKTYPSDIMTSPDPAKKLWKLLYEIGKFPVWAINFATFTW